VRCTASVRDGHVVITATPCPAAAPDPPGVSPDAPAGGPPGAPEPLPGQPIDEEVAPGITVRRLHPDDPSLQTFDFLRERHGPDIDQLPVVCVGAGEALRTTTAAVHAWARDYRSGDTTGRTFLGGYSAVALDDESSAHTLDLLRTRGVAGDTGALLAGAAGVLRFALTDEAREVSWQLPPDAPHAYFCDDCGQRRAEHRILRRDADAARGAPAIPVRAVSVRRGRRAVPGAPAHGGAARRPRVAGRRRGGRRRGARVAGSRVVGSRLQGRRVCRAAGPLSGEARPAAPARVGRLPAAAPARE
jgi:hypothetical protein